MPHVAKSAKQLTQIVRAKHWYLPHFSNLFEGNVWQAVQRNVPGWVGFERLLVLLFTESHFLQVSKRVLPRGEKGRSRD